MKYLRSIVFVSGLICFSSIPNITFAQSGGSFVIKQSVVAGGGGRNVSGGALSVDGTLGQAVAGEAITATPFAVTSGFWTPTLAPSAAEVSVSGRVLTANGNGLRNAIVTLTNQQGGSRSLRTSSFGYYRFDEVETGATYIIGVTSKRYRFTSQIISVTDELTELNLVAEGDE